MDSENQQIQTLPELQHFLAGYTDRDNLKTILDELYKKILGDPLPDEHFNTFRDLENIIRLLKDKNDQSFRDLQSEIDATQRGVGLELNGNYSPDAYTHYLKEATSVMNALRTLDQLIYEAMTNVNLEGVDTNTVDIDVVPLRDKTTVSAKVKLASRSDNQIVVEQDGIFHSVDFNYESGRLDLIVNGSIIKYFDLGISGIVSNGYYDSGTEELVIVLSLKGGEESTLRIPVHSLIEEWEIINDADHAVLLERTRNVSGKDTLAADVKISTNTKNILVKDASGKLLVKGTADNISMNSGETVEQAVKDLNSNMSEYSSSINSLRDSVRDCQQECKSNSEKVGKLEGTVGDLSEEFNEHKVQVEKDKAEINKSITELSGKVEANTSGLASAKESIKNLTEATAAETLRATQEEDKLRDA